MSKTTRRILVTGAQGFIGRYLVADWLTADPDATVLGIGRSERLNRHFTHAVHWGELQTHAPLPELLVEVLGSKRYHYVALDMADTSALAHLLAESRPHIVVHLAASLRDDPPAQLVKANIGTVASLFESIAQSGVDPPRIVFGSSGFIYGHLSGRTPPLHEDDGCAPIDPYSATKLAAEELGRILARQHGVTALWARIFNPVGPGQDERHICGWLGRQMAAIANGIQDPVVSVGPLDTTRDFIDVRDTASALRLIALRGTPGLAYNVASGQETSGQQLFDMLIELIGLTGRVTVDRRPARPVDIHRHYANIARLTATGHRCRFQLGDSLSDVLEYYRQCVSASVGYTGGKSRI